MYTIRAFESQLGQLVRESGIGRFVHLSTGQEAIAVGVCAALCPADLVALTYRNHGVLLARGADPRRLLAEILGKRTGYCGGRAGSMHTIVQELGVIDASAVVSANIPIGTGSALASWLQEDSTVTACFFGDGAVSEGGFHESLNMAALWKLPIVYICENNNYAMSTPFEFYSPVSRVSDRAAAYGIQVAEVDGNDVWAVRAAAQAAVERARNGQGPSLVECHTILLQGHYVGHRLDIGEDCGSKRASLDPLPRLRAQLRASLSEREIAEIEAAVDSSIQEAAVFADGSAYPEPRSLLEDDFVEP
jgi:pyruvate dehydrogenase E1 component alpha subunit